MRASPRVRLTLAFAAGFAACPLAFWAFHLRAQESPRGVGGRDPRLSAVLGLTALQPGGLEGRAAPESPREPTAVAYIVPPVTARAARTWETLQKPVKLDLKGETTIEDFFKAVRQAAKGPDDKGIQIYVDPIALQDAEKTPASTLSVQLEDVPLATVLTLALKQLGLGYYVHQDGIVMIVGEDHEEQITDPSAKILSELADLREDVAALRKESRIDHQQPEARAKEIAEARAKVIAELRSEIASLRAEVGRRRPEREPNAATPKAR